jgi:hypothetical protein
MSLENFLSYLSDYEHTRALALSMQEALWLRGVPAMQPGSLKPRVPVAG